MKAPRGILKQLSRSWYGDPADPSTAAKHRETIQRKAFLRKTYHDFYIDLRDSIASAPPGQVLEVGSGGGILKEIMPEALTSDVVTAPWLDMVLSAECLPIKESSLSAIVCMDVMHHISEPEGFLREASRCLKSGGKVAMIEPFNSLAARVILKTFHDEPFDENVGWETLPWRDGLTANQALPWIMFVRDRATLEQRFAEFSIARVEPHTPFRWLLSGGVRGPYTLPGFTYPVVRGMERAVSPLRGLLSLHMTIELVRL